MLLAVAKIFFFVRDDLVWMTGCESPITDQLLTNFFFVLFLSAERTIDARIFCGKKKNDETSNQVHSSKLKIKETNQIRPD